MKLINREARNEAKVVMNTDTMHKAKELLMAKAQDEIDSKNN